MPVVSVARASKTSRRLGASMSCSARSAKRARRACCATTKSLGSYKTLVPRSSTHIAPNNPRRRRLLGGAMGRSWGKPGSRSGAAGHLAGIAVRKRDKTIIRRLWLAKAARSVLRARSLRKRRSCSAALVFEAMPAARTSGFITSSSLRRYRSSRPKRAALRQMIVHHLQGVLLVLLFRGAPSEALSS